MARPNDENPAAPIFRILSGGMEPDDYELDSKSWPTWRRYRAAFNRYADFCEETGAQPFPATVPTIRAFFRCVVEGGGAVVSCDITKQVIKLVHRLRGYPPVEWDRMREFHQGVRRRHGGARRQAQPLRTGREAQQVIIPAPDVPLVAAWLNHWERIAGRVPGRLIFAQVSRSDRITWKPMAPTAVTAVVRKNVLAFLLAAGMEEVAAVALASCYRSHSLRAGYASSASAGGVVEAEIREQCRHKSAETTARYIRIGRKWEAGGLKGLLPDGGRGDT
jgi:integrase